MLFSANGSLALPAEPEERGGGGGGGDLARVAKRSGSHSSAGRSETEKAKNLEKGICMSFFTGSKEPKAGKTFLQKVVRLQRKKSQGNSCNTAESLSA